MAELVSVGSFATEGERKAAAQLRQLPASWLVICNKLLPTSNGRSYEIDFIIVGNRWIFLLDEKSWSGKIRGTEEQWVFADGSSERSPLAKIDYVAKILAGHVSWRVTALKNSGHFVHSGVLLSNANQSPQIQDPRAANGISLLGDICERLSVFDNQGGNPQVGQLHHHIKKALVGLPEKPKVPSQINLFTTNDAITLRPGVRIFHATMKDNANKPYILMVYELGKDPFEAQEQRNFYLQEFNAVQKLHATGLIPEMSAPFIWSDDFLVLPIVPPAGKSLSAYPLPETREEFVQDLMLAAACFKGLDQIHANDVLHRAIGPDTIYVQAGQPPKIVFTNFYAARVGTKSIAVSLNALAIEDPYASPDLAVGYEFATPETDIFSLTLVWLERLAGTSISNIRADVESPIVFPKQWRWPSYLSIELSEELISLFKQIIIPAKDVAVPLAKEIAARFTDLARYLRTEVSGEEECYLMDKRYKVQRLLGQGTTARTYLASHTDMETLGVCVLKQFLRPAEVYEQAVTEYRVLNTITSKYLPRINDIYRPEDDVHIKMEYIPGPMLQQVEFEFPWSLERWWVFAQDLLNAVEDLEQKQLLHRDIKPANIILHEADNRPVLIDFGLAIQQGIASRTAGTPLYLPPEVVSAPQPPPSSDRYAIGVVLFKVLTGYLPFSTTVGSQRHLVQLEQIADEKVRKIAAVLLRTVSNDPTERPTTISQIRNDLQTVVDPLHASVDGLPYPLASVLRRYIAKSAIDRRVSRLLQYFEVTAAFSAIVLLSAFCRDARLFESVQRELTKADPAKRRPQLLERADFGQWIQLGFTLAKAVRRANNDKALNPLWSQAVGPASDVATLLSSADYWTLLERTRLIRNERAHGSVDSDTQSKTWLRQLDGMLHELVRITGSAWEQVRLLCPDTARLRSGVWTYPQAKLLVGSNDIFEEVEFTSLEPIETGQLVLASQGQGHEILPIVPLVRLNTPTTHTRIACYFFSARQGRDTFRYVSYHYEDEPQKSFEDKAVGDLIRSLTLSSDGQGN